MFIVAGLSSDFNMKPIGEIISLVPLADEIIKLSALCVYCKDGTPANFTKLIKTHNNESSSNVLVGAKDSYSPCCRKHFLMF
jgi:thymidine kinase